jgi:hypothetical protein
MHWVKTGLFLLLVLQALGQTCFAGERETHDALLELFAPREMWQPELYEQSWSELSAYPPSHDLWKRLEGVAALPLALRQEAFQNLLEENGDGPARFLQARQLYLGWVYEGQRGRLWAGLPDIAPSLTGRPSPTPNLPAGPFRLQEGELRLLEGELDFLIVGSGPAGSVLGHELSRAGCKVVIVERGPFVLPDRLDTREVPRLKVGGGAVPTSDFGVLVRTADAVGGGSTVNVDLAFAPTLPIVSKRLQAWRESGAIGPEQWTPEQVTRGYAWVVDAVGTRDPLAEEVNANNRILWDGALATGLQPAFYSLNTWAGRPPSLDKRSAVNGLILQAMAREKNPLWLLPDLDARRILVREGRVLGLELQALAPWRDPAVWVDPHQLDLSAGAVVTLKARNVIVCAGAQGSAALLLRSGLGGPAVGKGVILHPSMPLIGRFDRRIDATEGTPSTVYAVDPEDPLGVLYECMAAGPQYVGLMLFGSGREIGERVKDFGFLGGFGVLLIDSVNDLNRIELDAAGNPRIIYALGAEDKRRFASALGRAARAMLAAGALEVYLPSAEPYLEGKKGHLAPITSAAQTEGLEDRLRFLPGHTIVTSAHMQSSCKMGGDPATSVVDWEHRVRGVHGLYVCDSSVFPTSVGANPMQMIYTMAKLFSERLLEDEAP